jgi:diacylglycerol O-acyltransferase / wax synthase
VATPIDPTSTAFLLAENRSMPMHVGGLQLFEKPEGAGRDYTRHMFEAMRDVEEIRPLYLKHPYRSIRTGGQLFLKEMTMAAMIAAGAKKKKKSPSA